MKERRLSDAEIDQRIEDLAEFFTRDFDDLKRELTVMGLLTAESMAEIGVNFIDAMRDRYVK